MTKQEFTSLIAEITESIQDQSVDSSLSASLNQRFGPHTELFDKISSACHQAIDEGWMCNHEMGGIKFGRVIKPGQETHGFSVDVVHMKDVKGPHHRHPKGEIDLILPISGTAKFDGIGAGWLVYGPGSAHYPTVSDGEALVLYLLPDGEIEFTK